MFERFTDRARKAMARANQEAQRCNHEYIGTEHILLGLIKEGNGVGAHVLKNLGVDPLKLRVEIERLMKPGPEMVTMGKLPQTPRAKHVIEYAIEEARGLNHNYVGTEHLLLGLMREEEGIAGQVLANMGLKLVQVREEILNLLGAGEEKEVSTTHVGPLIGQPGSGARETRVAAEFLRSPEALLVLVQVIAIEFDARAAEAEKAGLAERAMSLRDLGKQMRRVEGLLKPILLGPDAKG